MTIFLYLSTAFDVSKSRTLPPPVFVEMRQTIQPQRGLKLCAIHFRRKTYCNLQVIHSACIWRRRYSTLTCLRKGGKRKISHLLPANLIIFHKFGIQAFTWFSRKIWHPFYIWSDKFPSFHPSPLCCSSLEFLQYFPRIRWFLLRQALAPLPRLDGMVTVAYVCLLGGQHCNGRCRRKKGRVKNMLVEI